MKKQETITAYGFAKKNNVSQTTIARHVKHGLLKLGKDGNILADQKYTPLKRGAKKKW